MIEAASNTGIVMPSVIDRGMLGPGFSLGGGNTSRVSQVSCALQASATTGSVSGIDNKAVSVDTILTPACVYTVIHK